MNISINKRIIPTAMNGYQKYYWNTGYIKNDIHVYYEPYFPDNRRKLYNIKWGIYPSINV